MTGDAKPNEKLFYVLPRLKETRVSAVEKAGYLRVTIKKLKKNPLLQLFFGIFLRIPALNFVGERIIAKLMTRTFSITYFKSILVKA